MEPAEDWMRLGERVVARREELGMSTRQAMAEVSGLSYRVLGDLERGARPVSDRTLSQLDQALGWRSGSARKVLRGGEPALAEPPKLDSLPASWMHALGEAYRVTAELAESGLQRQSHRLTRALNEVSASLATYSAAAHVVHRPDDTDMQPIETATNVGNPTVLGIALGRYLKQKRERRNLTPEWVSESLGYPADDIRRLERGLGIFPDHALRKLLNLYGVSDPDEQLQYLAISGDAGRSGWWMRYDDVVPTWFEQYLQLEQRADSIRTFEAHYVPGLLQTLEYAQAVMGPAFGGVLTRKLGIRMERQRILADSEQFRLWAVIDESVLLRGPDVPGVMRRQINHLIEMSQRPNITIQILPLQHFGSPVPSFSILRFRDSGVPDVVYIEQLTSALYLDRQADVEPHYDLINRFSAAALPPDASARHLLQLRQKIDFDGHFEITYVPSQPTPSRI
ncbi:Scr1 family TA system antitoxin-like transcriptional regulator [Nocardia takedensis]